MISGFNTEIEVDGEVFHLQTEDKGIGNPIVETLVYKGGGEIIASRRTSYKKLIDDDNCTTDQVVELMRKQHKDILLAIKNKTFKYILAEHITPETIKESPEDSTFLDSIMDYLNKKG